MTKGKREVWILKNPRELQEFDVGESFAFKNQVLKICFVSSLSGVKTGVERGHFFTIDDSGYVEKTASSIEERLFYFSDQDMIYKVRPTEIENGEVVYTPVYERG